MTITPEQRTCARLADILMLALVVLELGGDSVTISARGGETFAEKARFAAEHAVLRRLCLPSTAAYWISIGVLAFVPYVVLEPVNKRLAQLALFLRLGAGWMLVFLLFPRARHLPRVLAGFGIVTSALPVAGDAMATVANLRLHGALRRRRGRDPDRDTGGPWRRPSNLDPGDPAGGGERDPGRHAVVGRAADAIAPPGRVLGPAARGARLMPNH